MTTIRNYGPSILVIAVLAGIVTFGPGVMRDLVYADQNARIELAADNLAANKNKLAELSQAFRDVAQVVEPSVVHIAISRKASSDSQMRGNVPPEMREFFRRFGTPDGGRGDGGIPAPRDDGFDKYDVPEQVGSGSGWVYDKLGHIVTNYHVVKDADEIDVRFYDKSTKTAKVIGVDPNTDIAVLKVEADNLHPAKLAERSPEQGELVFAFGSPFSFEFSMSQGIVSGKGRHLGILGNSGYESFLQTDAAINPGNSGGPLCSIYGQVVGMNSAIATRTGAFNGIGFAIPVEMLQRYIPQLIAKGSVARGYLGVMINDNVKLLKSFGVDHGVVVDDLVGDGPAGKAGIQRGDVITEVNGKKVGDAAHLRQMIADFGPGTEVKLTVLRDGTQMPMTVKLVELPKSLTAGVTPDLQSPVAPTEQAMAPLRKLGLDKVSTMTQDLADSLRLEFRKGVLVEQVRRGSVAASEGMSGGMIIDSVMGKPVETVAELAEAMSKQDLTQGVRLSVIVRGPAGLTKRFVLLQLSSE